MLTSLDFLRTGQPWPPVSEAQRLREYADNKLLFEGEHATVFNDWYKILREDQKASLEFVFNLFKRLSTLWADLLVGEPPRFAAGDDESAAQKTVDRIVATNALTTTAYEVVLDISRYGDGVFKIRLEDRQAIIEGQPPSYWFPVSDRDNLRRVQAHVLAWTFDVTVGRTTDRYLRAEIHTRGQIENRVYELKGNAIGNLVALNRFFPGRAEVEATKVPDFLVVPVSGLRTTDRYFGLDDYGDLINIVQELEVRVAQISRILDKHAAPSMYGPPDHIDVDPEEGESSFAVQGGRYYNVDKGETAPGYITWEGQLEAAFKELEQLIKLFYVVSETSPAAFGQLEQGLAESGSALRRLLMAPLAKVNRVRLRLDPSLKTVLRVAADLERANGGDAPALPDISIGWRDGVPDDPMEQAQVEQLRQTAGNASLYSQIKRLDGGTDKEIHEEIDRIAEDEARSAALAPAIVPGAISQPPEGRE